MNGQRGRGLQSSVVRMRSTPVVPRFDIFHHRGPRGEVVVEVVLVILRPYGERRHALA